MTKGNHQSLWTPVRALWWGKLSDARRRELVDFDWHSLRHFTAHFFYVVRGVGIAGEGQGHALGAGVVKVARGVTPDRAKP